ncbi:MAG: hypothetical protein WBF67_09080 [Olleya sp.]
MKINTNFLKALKSAQIVLLAIMLFGLFLLMTFYPSASWAHMLLGLVFIIVIQALVIASGFKNDTEILED